MRHVVTTTLANGITIHYIEFLSVERDIYYHREDGPAIEWPDGEKYWHENNKQHRIDGPAVELCGRREWWVNNLLHRLDGPAIEDEYEGYLWYYKGEYINCSSQEEFERLIKMKAFW